MGGPRAAGRLDGAPVLVADPARQGEGQLVEQREHLGRVTGLGGGLLDAGRLDALADHGDALVDELADHPRGEEAARVVDHDRRPADLPDQVEGPGQRLVPGLRPADDLHQPHLVDRREEVQPDEVGGALHALGEQADRQGGGVGAEQRVGGDDPLDLLEHLVLELRVLEDRLDHRVAAGQVGRVGGGGDPGEHLVALRPGAPAPGHRLRQQTLGVGLPALGGLDGDVLEQHLDPGLGADVGDAGAHHPRAEHGDPADRPLLHRSGPPGTGVDRLEVEEEGLDHVLAGLPAGQLGEVAGLDRHRRVDVHLGALHRRGEHVARRRVGGAGQLLAQVGGEGGQVGGEGRGARGAAGDLVALDVPGLDRGRVRLDPGSRPLGQLLGRGDEFVDQTVLEGLRRAVLAALQQELEQGVGDAEQPHRADDPAAAGEQAEGDLGQADPARRVVQGDPAVAGEGEFQAAAERAAVDRGDDRQAERLQGAQGALDPHRLLEDGGGVLRAGGGEHPQVAAGEEGLLGGGDHHSAQPAGGAEAGQPGDDGLEVGGERLVHGVDGLGGVVEDEGDHAVLGLLPADGGGVAGVAHGVLVS